MTEQMEVYIVISYEGSGIDCTMPHAHIHQTLKEALVHVNAPSECDRLLVQGTIIVEHEAE